MAFLVGELERNTERGSDAEGTFQLTDVEANRISFRHRKLDLVTGKVFAVK